MNQLYTSKGIVRDYPIGKPILVHFSRSSSAYKEHGDWVVGWRFEQDVSSFDEIDFPVSFEINAQANSQRVAGSEYEAEVPSGHKRSSFRGSEVRLIEKYG